MLGAVARHPVARPRRSREVRRAGGLAGGAGHRRSCWPCEFDPAGPQYQFVEDYPWIPTFGTGYILGLDGIALALVVLTAVLVPLLIVAGWNDGDRRGMPRSASRSTQSYLALTLAVEGMVLISLVALDVLLFYVFFEAMLIPMYFLIGGFGGAGQVESGGEVPAVQPVRRTDHAGRGHRPVRGDRGQRPRRHLRLPGHRRRGRQRRPERRPGAAERVVPRLHVRVRGEGAAVAVPPLAARRRRGVHPGDRGADDGRRRQGRHLRRCCATACSCSRMRRRPSSR